MRLSERVACELARQSAREYPREACGVLLGLRAGDMTRVERAFQARNLATERAGENYVLDPGDFVAAELAARAAGLAIVGVWHSHPDRVAQPSEVDRVAAWHEWVYLIVPVTRAGAGVARAWRLCDQCFVEECMTT